jgi:hypothetical protein
VPRCAATFTVRRAGSTGGPDGYSAHTAAAVVFSCVCTELHAYAPPWSVAAAHTSDVGFCFVACVTISSLLYFCCCNILMGGWAVHACSAACVG